jgi:TP901 family phage tail tape measure protein
MNAYKEFEFSMVKIIGLVGIAKKQVEGWSDEIRAMAKNIGFAPNALADALYYVTSSGFKTNEALNIVNQSAKAAAAGLGETKDVADLITSVMNAYGQGNISAAKTLDILVAAIREGKGEASEYAKVLGSVVPFASQLGVKFEEVAGSVAAMTLSGASAANAATYLRNVFMKLLKPAKQSEDALRAMGSSSLELRNILQQRGVLAALMKIRELTDKYGDEMMGKVIPNIRAMLAELMLTGKNFEYNAKVMDLVANSAGSLASAYGIVYNSLQKRMDRLSAQVKDSMITIGESIQESVMPALEALGKSLENLSIWFSQLSDQWKRITTAMAGALAVIGPLALIISTLAFAFKGTWSVLKNIGAGFIWLKDIIALNTKGFRHLITVFGSLAKPIVIALKYIKQFAGAFGPIIGTVLLAYKVLKGYEKGVIEAAKANSVFEKTLVNVNDEVKKIGEVKAQDWATMDYERLMKWNMWAEKSVANTKEWIKYFYKLAGVSAENATKYTDVLAQGNKASEKDLKEATKNMGRWEDQIGIYQERLNAGLAMLSGTGDALAEKFEEFSKIGRAPTQGAPLNMAFGIREVQQAMSFVDEQLNQIKWLEEAYRNLGVRGYDANSKKIDVLNETLLKLIENGWGASKEAKELARQINALGGLAGSAENSMSKLTEIMQDFGEKSKSLSYMASNAGRFGLELDYIAEKTKLVKDTLEKVAETKGLNTKFAQDLIQMLEKMPPNVYSVSSALDNLKKSFSGVDLEVEILGPNVEGTEKKIKILEDTIQDIVKATKEMQNLDSATLGDLGFKDFNLGNVKVIDWIKSSLKDLNEQLKEYQSTYADEEFKRSQTLLESQASVYGTLNNKMEVVSREISYLERKLYQASTAMAVNKEEVSKYADQLTKAKLKMAELQSASDVTHFQALYNAFGGLSNASGLLSAKLDLAREKFFLLSELTEAGVPGASAQLETATGDLKSLLQQAEQMERLEAVYQSLGNAIADFAFQVGKSFGGAEEGVSGIVDTLLQSGQQIISMLLAQAAAAVLAGETIKGMGLPGLIAGAVGIGVLSSIWESAKSNMSDVAKLAKGGVVPDGFPNDTYPALLTSGEMVIPKNKYKDIEPLHTLAKKGSLEYKEFLDAPSSMLMAKKIELPKLQHGGIIPPGYPNDTYPAFLSSGEIVMPGNLLQSMAATYSSSSDSWLKAILDELKRGNKGQEKVDPILEGINRYQQKALEENRTATKLIEQNSALYQQGTEKYYEILNSVQDVGVTIKDKGFFKLKDISETGGVGLRHGAEINKSVLADLSKAAAKESVPLMTALETAMRETGIGSYMSSEGSKVSSANEWYDPHTVMQGWGAVTSSKAGMPMSYDQFIMNKGLVPKEATYKNKYGYQVDFEKYNELEGAGAEYKHASKYYDYIKNFKLDSTILEPFRKEMRYLKQYPGQAYNPGEKGRESRLAYDRSVILKNEDFYNFADSVYKANQTQTDFTAGTKVVPMMTGVTTLLSKLFAKKQTTEKEPGVTSPVKYDVPEGYTGALFNYMKNLDKPKYEGPEFKKLNENVKQQTVTNLKIHNFISDVATGVATWGTQLRKPTVEEYEAGRAGGMGRADVLAKSATWGGVDLLTEGFMSKALPVVTNKLANIPGLTAEAPDKGYHALLNKKHWAWNPKEFLEGGASKKQLAVLYAQAAANRMMPVVAKTPLVKPVRKVAEKVIGASGAPMRSTGEILDLFKFGKKKTTLEPYSGVIPTPGYDEEKLLQSGRSLVKLYLYGIEKGFTEVSDDILRIPLERYQKLYPKAKSYIMESHVPHGEFLTPRNASLNDIDFEKFKKGPSSISSTGDNMIQPIDDIAGHMAQLVKRGKEFTWVTQDLWKFNPKDFSNKWISDVQDFGIEPIESSEYLKGSIFPKFEKLMLEKQAGMMDKIGKPFYLIQNNPVSEQLMGNLSAIEASKSKYVPSTFDMYHDKWGGVSHNLMNKLPAIGGVGLGMGAMTLGGEAKAGELPKTNLDELLAYNDILKQTYSLLDYKTKAVQADTIATQANTVALTSNTVAAKSIGNAETAISGAGGIVPIVNEGLGKLRMPSFDTDLTKLAKGPTMEEGGGGMGALFGSALMTMLPALLGPVLGKTSGGKNPMGGILSALIPTLLSFITGASGGGILKILGAIFGRGNRGGSVPFDPVYMAKGGIVPPGFPNDTYPAWLSSGEIVLPSSYKDLDIERLTGKGSLPTGDLNDEFQLLLSTYEKVLPEQSSKEKAASRIYNYNNITEHSTKVPRLKSMAKEGAMLSKYLSKVSKEPRMIDRSLKGLKSISKFPKEVGISDKYIKRLGTISKPPITKSVGVKIPKIKMPKDVGVKIPKIKMPKDMMPKVPGIKVTKDKTLNYLSKISKTRVVDEKSFGSMFRMFKPKISREKAFDSITKVKSSYFKNIYKESRLNEKAIEKLSKTLVGSKYMANISRMSKLSKGGIIPKGYPRDTYLARLSSGERVIPPQKLDHLEPANANIHITLDGKVLNRDLALMIRRMYKFN